MNAEEDYGFDVSGFLHLPQVLTAAEVLACDQANRSGRPDGGHARLAGTTLCPVSGAVDAPGSGRVPGALCGAGFTVDKGPSLVADGPEGTAGVPLTTGPVENLRRLRYANFEDTRVSKGNLS